jgi:hypothetical protein
MLDVLSTPILIIENATGMTDCRCVSTVVILATSRPLDFLIHPFFQLTFSLHH